jgi:hypothetical protein
MKLVDVNDFDIVRAFKHPSEPMRSVFGVIAFAGQRSVKLPHSGCIVVPGIDCDCIVTKVQRERLQTLLNQLSTDVVIGQVNAKKQVRAVPAVTQQRSWKG